MYLQGIEKGVAVLPGAWIQEGFQEGVIWADSCEILGAPCI